MTQTFNRVLVVGCGYIGSALAEILNTEKKTVWGVKRTPLSVLPDYPIHYLDILSEEGLKKLPDDIQNVVYAVSPSGGSEQDYYRSYIEGVERLSTFLKTYHDCRRFILTSSTGAYEINDGSWVSEDSNFRKTKWKSRLLYDAERQVEVLWSDSSSVRFGGIYGPGRNRMIQLAADGSTFFDEQFPRYTNRIHRDDCAGFIAHLLSLNKVENLYNGVDNDPCSRKDLFQWLSLSLNAPKPQSHSLSDEERLQLGQGKRCSNKKLLNSGYELLYPSFRQGYAAQLEPFLSDNN